MRPRALVKRAIPASARARIRHLREHIRIWAEAIEDARRHSRLAAASDSNSGRESGLRQLEAQITKDYHRIEKGLALKAPRPGFGSDVAGRLSRDLNRYPAMVGHDPAVAEYARSALADLNAWHSVQDREGVVTKPHNRPASVIDAESFFASRSSVRDFANRPVEPGVIQEAAELALWSPSVCNRQAWGLWAFHDRATVQALAALQNGNAGFREQIPCLIVVAVDARLFAGAGERNQRWIDGGLYAMSLVWALHALGVDSCMLNWSVENAHTARLRAAADIPDHFDVITMVAVGYAREGARVTRSPRRHIEQVLHSDQA